MKNVLKALAKSTLIPLWLTAAVLHWLTTLIISNEEMNDIMKIV